MTLYTDILVRSPPESVQNYVQQAFVANEYRITWDGPQQGRAEKGSRGANIALGAFAQYYAIDFRLGPGPGGTTLRLLQSNSGAVGGLLGMDRVKKQFQALSRSIATWFQQGGILLGVNEGKI